MPLSGAELPATSDTREPKGWLTVPNALTLVRLLSILPFAVLASQGRDRAALILFVVAGLTDTLDGTIARALNQRSKIGRLLDPLADKLFTGAAYLILSLFRGNLSHIPVWVMMVVILRDLFILGGSFLVFSASRNSGFQPSLYGKLNTFIEIGVIVLFLAQPDLPFLARVLPTTYVLLLVSLLLSGGDYLLTGIRMVKAARNVSRP
jgi:cardiolipin synthase